jgi:mannose-6-phosphate isomerase-like protein (cupin superfamily)
MYWHPYDIEARNQLAREHAERLERDMRWAERAAPTYEGSSSVIRQGDSIENQVTGERLVFLKTSRETNGELVVVEAFVKPTGFVASAHLHPYQEERFHVLRGTVGFKLDRSRLIAGPGQRITVPAGTPHKFWNAGEDEARFECEVRPALQFEQLIETMFGLAADGKTNTKGMPNPLRLAVIARAHFDDVRLPFPPEWMQRMGLALGAPLGRLLGYQSVYVALGVEAAAAAAEVE